MGISLNGAVNSIKNVTIATLGTGQPNWSYIPSAAKQEKTQAEFIAEIKGLARNAATATNKADKDSIDRQLLQLRAEYLSDVSPDRKSLYQSAKNAMGLRAFSVRFLSSPILYTHLHTVLLLPWKLQSLHRIIPKLFYSP